MLEQKHVNVDLQYILSCSESQFVIVLFKLIDLLVL